MTGRFGIPASLASLLALIPLDSACAEDVLLQRASFSRTALKDTCDFLQIFLEKYSCMFCI